MLSQTSSRTVSHPGFRSYASPLTLLLLHFFASPLFPSLFTNLLALCASSRPLSLLLDLHRRSAVFSFLISFPATIWLCYSFFHLYHQERMRHSQSASSHSSLPSGWSYSPRSSRRPDFFPCFRAHPGSKRLGVHQLHLDRYYSEQEFVLSTNLLGSGLASSSTSGFSNDTIPTSHIYYLGSTATSLPYLRILSALQTLQRIESAYAWPFSRPSTGSDCARLRH